MFCFTIDSRFRERNGNAGLLLPRVDAPVLSQREPFRQFRSVGYLQSIDRLAENNMGGLVQIQVARKADIASIPVPVAGVIYGNITFNGSAGWVTWNVLLQSAQLRSAENTTREGSAKSKSLEFVISKDSSVKRAMLELAERDEFVVLYRDANGRQKLFGLPHAPVRFVFNHDTGRQFSDLNGYSCRFYYKGPENEYVYNGAISTPPAGAAPAVVYFNGQAIASLAPGQSLYINSDYSLSEYFSI